MFSYVQVIIFGIVQGVTELFPISSLGHSVILPKLVGWNINQQNPFFLTFLVATHTATALVLFFFFFNDWKKIISGLLRSLKEREIKSSDPDAKLGWLLIVATVPAGLLGILFEEKFKLLFADPRHVAMVLILNGFLLYGAELLAKKRRATQKQTNDSNTRISHITFRQAVAVGLLQCLALIPGFSRTGAAITGGLLIGLSHEDAARYAFFLATPIIGAASLLKIPDLATQAGSNFLPPILIGAITAGFMAYLSVKFLTKYFHSKTLTPFAIYCIGIGSGASLIFLLR